MSALASFSAVSVGDAIPELRPPAISRATLAYYAGASGDRNPMHIDLEFARAAGQPDVFAQGMLVMAYAGRLLTDWAGPQALRRLSARFAAITQVHEQLYCSARITAKSESAAGRLVDIAIEVRNDEGQVKLLGAATVALP